MKRLADIKGIRHIASLLAVIFFALNIPATSYILNGQVGVLGYVLLRTFGGAAVCWVLSMFIKHEPITSKKDKITIVFAGVIGLFVFFYLFAAGIKNTSPIDASIILTITPIMVFIVSSFLFKEKMTKKKPFCFSLLMLGIAI